MEHPIYPGPGELLETSIKVWGTVSMEVHSLLHGIDLILS